MINRVLGLLFILGCTLFGLWWCALPVVFVYMLLYGGSELILVALAVDAMFGTAIQFPSYTLGTAIMYLCFIWLKPRFLFYTERT